MVTNRPPDALDTERLHLRRLRLADASLVFENWAQEEAVTKYLSWRPHTALEESEEHAERCEAGWEGGTCFVWVIEARATGEPLGSIAAYPTGTRVSLGYALKPAAWGKGLMVEAVTVLTDWFLAQAEWFRVWAICDVENTASARVLEKAGFELEGTLRRWVEHPNASPEPRDVLCYARVR